MVKHGDGSIQLWDSIMDSSKYQSILSQNLQAFDRQLKMNKNVTFHYDNDSRKKSRTVSEEWPNQSSDINPIKDPWKDMKKTVHRRSPFKLIELEHFVFLLKDWVLYYK